MNKRIKSISGYANVEKLKNNKQAVAFLVCVLIAAALWFLNALSKDYTTTISYPVKYVNSPSEQFLSNDPPSKINLKIDAHGFTLLRHKLGLVYSPIIFNLRSITKGVKPQKNIYQVKTNDHIKRIASQVSKEITILEVSPDVLNIGLDSMKSKDIPVKTKVNLNFKPQFNLRQGIILSHDTVKITGPAAIVDTIKFLYTEEKTYNKLDASVKKSLSIEHPKKTKITPSKVTLEINVEKYTEKNLKIPIKISNKPPDLNVKLFPSSIKLTCLVGLSKFDKITPADFTVVVDYEDISSSELKPIISIEKKPSSVQLIRFSPETVEYLIETY